MKSKVLQFAAVLLITQAVGKDVSEPAYVDVFYRLDGGTLSTLERQIAVVHSKAGGFMVMKTKAALQVDGGKSPVRFSSGVTLQFVVRPESGSTPTSGPASIPYCLRMLDTKKGARQIVIVSGYASPLGATSTVNASQGLVPLTATRYGAHSYRLLPSKKLRPGEYALSRTTGHLLFCFGVD